MTPVVARVHSCLHLVKNSVAKVWHEEGKWEFHVLAAQALASGHQPHPREATHMNSSVRSYQRSKGAWQRTRTPQQYVEKWKERRKQGTSDPRVHEKDLFVVTGSSLLLTTLELKPHKQQQNSNVGKSTQSSTAGGNLSSHPKRQATKIPNLEENILQVWTWWKRGQWIGNNE